jgi:hypothetical protein
LLAVASHRAAVEPDFIDEVAAKRKVRDPLDARKSKHLVVWEADHPEPEKSCPLQCQMRQKLSVFASQKKT